MRPSGGNKGALRVYLEIFRFIAYIGDFLSLTRTTEGELGLRFVFELAAEDVLHVGLVVAADSLLQFIDHLVITLTLYTLLLLR